MNKVTEVSKVTKQVKYSRITGHYKYHIWIIYRGTIFSRCSENEPALLPLTKTWRKRAAASLNVYLVYLANSGLLFAFKVGFYLKAVFPSRNLGLMRISCSCFKQSKNCSFIPRIYVLRSFVNFWVIFWDIWEEIVFLNGLMKFREIRNGVDLMWF